MNSTGLPLTLYIHIPFCVRKCPYCDFYSRPGFPVNEVDYVARLLAELKLRRAWLHADPRPLSAIFFGGGTPSTVQADSILTILDGVRALWPLTPDCEITLEANPESCHADKISGWILAGINRVSLGVQALNDARLQRLGRPHTRNMALNALKKLQESGLARLNVDLIHTTPGQTLAEWHQELEEILACGVGHLSCYGLTLEPDTPFHRLAQQGRLILPPEDEALAFFQFTRRFLAAHGYDPYEISNFAKPGQRCRHNVNYWEFGDYLGIGASAHGKWTDPDGQTWRTENARELLGQPFGAPVPIPPDEAGVECLMMGLRLREGVNRERHRWIAGRDVDEALLQELAAQDLLAVDSEQLRLTEAGTPLLDEILLQLTRTNH
ncbi:MAG: radical SAM family heme chaperone HemW [Magnetococcales bacterium]|nr:radical SAM family heme chaperone HemW [Magnetococcales bacterium]